MLLWLIMKMYSKEQEQSIFDNLKKLFTTNNKFVYAGTLLQLAYKRHPQKTALVLSNTSINYQDFYYKAICISKDLQNKFDIKPRDRVLLFYENSIDFYVAYFGIWHCGAVIIPVNIFLHERELAHIIQDSKPRAIIASSALKPKIEQLALEPYQLSLPPIASTELFDLAPVTEQEKKQTIDSFVVQELDSEEMCVLLYTSGTTGLSKGVMLSSKNVVCNALQGYARFSLYGLSHDERFFCVLPLFHVFAQNVCLWLPTIIGATVIIVSKIDRKLMLDGLAFKPTIFFGFPALYGLLCLMRTAPLNSVKMFVSGADMLPDKIRHGFALTYGRKICAGYGLSEASPTIAVNHENVQVNTTVVGYPLVGIECSIRDNNGQSLPINQTGILWVKGDNIMMGYYKTPQATSEILVDGWLNTGDLANIDANGRLAISGRTKDIIIHKGFNIYPAEIENILLSHPAVFKAAVIGQAEDLSGQIPIAFVATKTMHAGLEESLRNLCMHSLAGYKVPKKFVCLEDLPMSATGKIDKKQLQQHVQSL